jgi:hypothetical protein
MNAEQINGFVDFWSQMPLNILRKRQHLEAPFFSRGVVQEN